MVSIYHVPVSDINKDIPKNMSLGRAKEMYLDEYGSFKSLLPFPAFYRCKDRPSVFILDFAKGPCGLKAYGAEKLIANLEHDTVAYAAPRVGHAPEAIAYLCEKYNKRGVFFAAASQEITPHQAVVLGYKGCELRFVRIPAMPTMNCWIKRWAAEYGAIALPFGLSGVKEVTAALVAMCEEHIILNGEPPEFYCAVSTGTMIRALQIGWPNALAYGVAVARNMKAGEIGEARVHSYHKSFYKKADKMPYFETTGSYDAKAYDHFLNNARPGSVFINVGSDKQIEKRLEFVPGWQNINAKREWGDMEAFSYA
jgi:hypothetical protein